MAIGVCSVVGGAGIEPRPPGQPGVETENEPLRPYYRAHALRRTSELAATIWRRHWHAVGGIFVEFVAQGADRNAEDIGGVGAVAQAVFERFQDEIALDVSDSAAHKRPRHLLGGESGM